MLWLVNEGWLFVSAVVVFAAVLEIGFRLGQQRQESTDAVGRTTAIFALLIAMVLTIILDMDRPRRGLIRVDEGGMLRLRQTMVPAGQAS